MSAVVSANLEVMTLIFVSAVGNSEEGHDQPENNSDAPQGSFWWSQQWNGAVGFELEAERLPTHQTRPSESKRQSSSFKMEAQNCGSPPTGRFLSLLCVTRGKNQTFNVSPLNWGHLISSLSSPTPTQSQVAFHCNRSNSCSQGWSTSANDRQASATPVVEATPTAGVAGTTPSFDYPSNASFLMLKRKNESK